VASCNDREKLKLVQYICNSAVEPLSTHIIRDYDHNNVNIPIVLTFILLMWNIW
jgi:hypothetical protein